MSYLEKVGQLDPRNYLVTTSMASATGVKDTQTTIRIASIQGAIAARSRRSASDMCWGVFATGHARECASKAEAHYGRGKMFDGSGDREAQPAPLFEEVSPQRLSDSVVEMMLRPILAGELRPGDRLPSERDLGTQFGVSRTVIREAVRSLAAKGIITARRGSGLRVAAVPPAAVTESMKLFIRGSGALDYGQAHEVRTMIEIQVAGLAAARATDADILSLRRSCDEMAGVVGDVEALSLADVDFHRRIAEITHNDLYVVLLDSIADILLDIRRATLSIRASRRGSCLSFVDSRKHCSPRC